MKLVALPIGLSLAVAVFAMAACGQPQTDDALGTKVRAYLLEHPEILREMSVKLAEKEQAQASAKAVAGIRTHRKALEQDPRDFVANPNGKVTVTEFYDYRCPHCVNAAPAVLELIRTQPEVRFVFKELPIFGAPSERAAMAALTIKAKKQDYLAAYKALMASRPLDEAAIDRVLKAQGLSQTAVDDLSEGHARHLKETRELASAIGVEGTPAFIIGDEIISGEDIPAIKAAVAKALGR